DAAIDASVPSSVAYGVVLLGPLLLEQRFGAPVAALLPEISPNRAAPLVPDHRARRVHDRLAGFEQPPTEVDVVPGDPEARVEADVRDVLPGGRFEPRVAGRAQAVVVRSDDTEAVLRGDVRRRVDRSVVDDDDLVVGVVETDEPLTRAPDRP